MSTLEVEAPCVFCVKGRQKGNQSLGNFEHMLLMKSGIHTFESSVKGSYL